MMQVHRCPECGNRLKTNYCDICLRRVPFKGTQSKHSWQHEEGSSAHREENHECIDFGEEKKKPWKRPQPPVQKHSTGDSKKKTSIVAIILAAISVISSLFGLVEDFAGEETRMEYDQEAYVTEADLPVIQPTGIYSNGEIEIVADSLGLYYEEPALSFLIENQSEKDIDVMIEEVAVNGYLLDYGMSTVVDAGDSCQAFLSLYQYELEKADIEAIARVDLRLRVYDRSNYEEIAYLACFTIETDIADTYTQSVDRSGMELYNDGSVCVLLRNISLSGYGDGEMEVFIENLSGSDAMVYNTDLYLNAQKAEGHLYYSLMPETCAISSVYLTDLESLGIKELADLEEVTLALQVDYMDGWDILESHSESVTFEPSAIH